MTPTTFIAPPRTEPGWYADPEGRGQRYWNGRAWMSMKRVPRASAGSGSRDGGWVSLSGQCRCTAGY